MNCDNDRFHSLLDALWSNEIAPIDRESLHGLLRQDPQARHIYRRYFRQHAFLLWTQRAASPAANQLAQEFEQSENLAASDGSPEGAGSANWSADIGGSLASAGAAENSRRAPILGFIGGFWGALQSSPRTVALLLAGALGGYFLVVFALIPLARWAQFTRPADMAPAVDRKTAWATGETIGRLTFDAAARWSKAAPLDDKARVGYRYALESGRVSVALLPGSQMAIEGPATWHFDSDARLQFDAGEMAVYVPPRAIGFTVATPSAEVLDLGTEFNMNVASDGGTEVYVLTGKVALKTLTKEGSKAENVRVSAGAAARITAAGGVQSITLDAARFGSTRAALTSALRAQQAGHAFDRQQPVWLSNLFDDRPHVPLADALQTDTFGAEADFNDLGVDRVILGGDAVQQIAPHVKFDLTNLGWQSYGAPVLNDASILGADYKGIRVTGIPVDKNARLEDGICQTGNSLITFNLDDLRAAGRLQRKGFEFVCDHAGINDQWVACDVSSIHLLLVISTEQSVSTAYVDGKRVQVAEREGCWSVDSPIGEPLRGSGPIVSFQTAVTPDDKYLTLISTSAGDTHDCDQAAWIGARLEVRP